MSSSACSRATAAFAICAVLVWSAAFASPGSANTQTPQPSAGKLCNIREFPTGAIREKTGPRAAQASLAHGSAFLLGGLAKFVVERVAAINIEKYGLIGISELVRVIDAKGLTPDTMEQKVLAGLKEMNVRLDHIDTRIGQVNDRVNQVIDLHLEGRLADELHAICETANGQMVIYEDWKSAIEAGIQVGTMLRGPNPREAEEPNPRGNSPLKSLTRKVNEFLDHYRYGRVNVGKELATLRNALVANTANPDHGGALTNYGRVLMARHRFLTTAQSHAIRALYAEISEIRALTSWMLAEYWDAIDDSEKEGRVWNAFQSDHSLAAAGLPKMIPPGVVVDVGTEKRDTANGRAMWFAPTEEDLGWLPGNLVAGTGLILDEVPFELENLNHGGKLGYGWHAPDKQEFLAMISSGCSADPSQPAKPLVGCTNAVPGNANIAAYLQPKNPDRTWQMLFCQPSAKVKCPTGAGPTSVRKKPHAFIWTSDKHSQRLVCGTLKHQGSAKAGEVARDYITHAGYLTLGPVKHEVFPHLPQKVPDQHHANGAHNVRYVEEACAIYLKRLFYGNVRDDVKRNDLVEGVLLATRFTNGHDVNEKSNWDYMAQPVG